ncbi:hypothetical protein LCGC14_1496150 [marine sediment metagenome]|uniref:Uncharacterized protein n=1 Tax=marine sediment metagenome TaxID=412755 RepID=A0A0F9JRA0_9ZZZZ
MWQLLETLERAAPLLFVVVVGIALANCPQRSRYPGRNFTSPTSHKVNVRDGVRTTGGILTVGPQKDTTQEFRDRLDLQVDQLDQCLQRAGLGALQRGWFGVLVPSDWYVSPCTGQQLIPSRVDYRLCEQKRDPQGNPIKVSLVCRGAVQPTVACPCPCSFRSTIQNNFWIVTAPDLRLLKTELARLHTGVNAPWSDARLKGCL